MSIKFYASLASILFSLVLASGCGSKYAGKDCPTDEMIKADKALGEELEKAADRKKECPSLAKKHLKDFDGCIQSKDPEVKYNLDEIIKKNCPQ